MLITFSILGIIGGLLCAVADILWDFSGIALGMSGYSVIAFLNLI